MLDDENVLNQFHVRDYLAKNAELLTEACTELRQLATDTSEKKTPKGGITKLFVVAEDGGRFYHWLKIWLEDAKTELIQPVFLGSNVKSSWLDAQSLVLVDELWFDQARLESLQKRMRKLPVKFDSVVRSFPGVLVRLAENKIISPTMLRRSIKLLKQTYQEIDESCNPEVSVARNFAKQLALFAVGKTAVFTTTDKNQSLADSFVYYWRNTAHNLAFTEELAEQMISGNAGWSSHPVEKPFATFTVKYNFSPVAEQLIKTRSRELSGLMPASRDIEIIAENALAAAIKADFLANYSAAYLAVLNKQVLSH